MQELALHILDLAQNSVEAGARHVRIEVVEDVAGDRLTIVVADDGRGMDASALARATDPFYTTRTTRRVGLGLSLLAAAAAAAGGGLRVGSAPGQGTRVEATFQRSHLDRAPLGDVRRSLLALIAGCPEVTFSYRHAVDGRELTFDGEAFRQALDGLSPQHPLVLRWLEVALAEDGSAER